MKACCKHNLKVDPTINFCPTCGEKLRENVDTEKKPAKYGCAACCKASAYRQITYGNAVKFCPNCGKAVANGQLRDPDGFMSCCGGGDCD